MTRASVAGIVLVAILGLAGCEPAVEQVEGVVVHVDSEGLDQVEAFTIRTDDGRSIDFRVGVTENAAQFPPSHLSVHLADGVPVRVTYRREGVDYVAFRLEDAPS